MLAVTMVTVLLSLLSLLLVVGIRQAGGGLFGRRWRCRCLLLVLVLAMGCAFDVDFVGYCCYGRGCFA